MGIFYLSWYCSASLIFIDWVVRIVFLVTDRWGGLRGNPSSVPASMEVVLLHLMFQWPQRLPPLPYQSPARRRWVPGHRGQGRREVNKGIHIKLHAQIKISFRTYRLQLRCTDTAGSHRIENKSKAQPDFIQKKLSMINSARFQPFIGKATKQVHSQYMIKVQCKQLK